jgi:hypothetical protein
MNVLEQELELAHAAGPAAIRTVQLAGVSIPLLTLVKKKRR